VLKGGLALDYRLGPRARTTRDMDLAWLAGEAEATQDLLDAQGLDLGDYFSFNITRLPQPEDQGERALRYRVEAELAGRTYAVVGLDVGLTDGFVDPPQVISTPDYLLIPGMEAPTIPVLALEQHVAEKVHAYTREYRSGPSSRVKDLSDIVIIATYEALRAVELIRALDATFSRRTSHDLPAVLPVPPSGWQQAFARQMSEVGIDLNLNAGFDLASDLLNPALARSLADASRWAPAERRWTVADSR
jgi:hypothetical protein